MANGTHVDELTPAVPADLADSDLVYVGLPGDADPDRKMTLANLRAYLDDYFALLTGATFTQRINGTTAGFTSGAATLLDLVRTGSAGNVSLRIAGDTHEGWFGIDRNGRLAFSDVSADLYGAGNPIAAYGTNASGSWVRYYNGVQIVWGEGNANYATIDYLVKSWTYPQAFTASPAVFATPDLVLVTPSITDMTLLHAVNRNATSVQFRFYRQVGEPNLVSGDAALLQYGAIGRWY